MLMTKEDTYVRTVQKVFVGFLRARWQYGLVRGMVCTMMDRQLGRFSIL
jgi:hypothetical protein